MQFDLIFLAETCANDNFNFELEGFTFIIIPRNTNMQMPSIILEASVSWRVIILRSVF